MKNLVIHFTLVGGLGLGYATRREARTTSEGQTREHSGTLWARTCFRATAGLHPRLRAAWR